MKRKKQQVVHAGGDVSSESIVVMLECDGQRGRGEFANNAAGHKSLIAWLKKRGPRVRMCIESTGIYSLDLALALHRANGVEVMVANPRAVADFGRALMQRSKTDLLDAEMILEFAMRMPFVAWKPPSPKRLDLRALMRRVTALKLIAQQENNRLHAASRSTEITPLVHKDVQTHLAQLERHIEKLEKEAYAIAQSDPELARACQRMCSVRGIARTSALLILAELVVLPPDMSARQWVAHAGLDPRQYDSGTSVHKPTRISHAGNKYLRAALYMPALVAVRYEPNVRAFYEKLVARGKTKMQAIVAVMRKSLHAIYGMLQTNTDFIGEKFYRIGA